MSDDTIRFAPFSPAQQEALARPFGPEAIRQKRGQGNRTMDYVSHGMVTKRLNDVAPGWAATMVERYVVEVNGQLHCLGGVMRLTIGGVTREEAGGPARLTTLADDLKNTYSDCLKRCAMRFGVALDLWESAEEHDEDAPQTPPDAPQAPERPAPARQPTERTEDDWLALANNPRTNAELRVRAARKYLSYARDAFDVEGRVRRLAGLDAAERAELRHAALDYVTNREKGAGR